ncbi:hypothetical protein B0O80DRAFT_286013 [Mortierella sp. GBAus27b]|nr:hypothetical protein B0O80DRAFT_286013 [Mortierella sp. GBAus27b]
MDLSPSAFLLRTRFCLGVLILLTWYKDRCPFPTGFSITMIQRANTTCGSHGQSRCRIGLQESMTTVIRQGMRGAKSGAR